MNVLMAPAEYYFKPGNYHVTYNLILRIPVKFDVICGVAPPSISMNNVKIHELRCSFLLYPAKVAVFGSKFARIADIIHHVSPFAIGKDFNFLSFLTNKPFIVGPMEIPHKFFEDEREMFRIPGFVKFLKDSNFREKLSQKTMERCDIAIAVNRATSKYLRNFIEKEDVKIIPLGVDTNFFKYYPVPNNCNILVVGIHIKRKGFNYIIKAMSEIVKEFPDTKLHITSTGPQTANLKKLVKQLQLENHVIFHGRVSDSELLNLYKNCRVFCHPSISESFSPVRLEAMAVGRPIVATTAASGAEEMINSGKTGLLVPPKDVDSLKKAILKILDNYKLSVKMGIRARRKVERIYDWSIVAEKYYEVYSNLI